MSVEECQVGDKPGFKWGILGKCFTYDTEEEKQVAKQQAVEQGRAIEAAKN